MTQWKKENRGAVRVANLRQEPQEAGGSEPPAGWAAGLRRWLGRPVDGAPLTFFRVAFGLLLAGDALAILVVRLDRLYVGTVLRFTCPGFEWVAPLPAAGLRALVVGLIVCALGLAWGRFARLAAWGFAAGWGYLFLLDAAAYNNHDYFIFLLALLFGIVPLPEPGGAQVPRWSLFLFQLQVAVPYVLGGVVIRQVAAHIEGGMRARGDYSVRAITSISYNGRPEQPLVRPAARLSEVERGFGGYGVWIEPLREAGPSL